MGTLARQCGALTMLNLRSLPPRTGGALSTILSVAMAA
jgi:hypothetical protein